MPLPISLVFVVLAAIGWSWTLLAFDRQETPPKIATSETRGLPIAFLWGALTAALVFVASTLIRLPALFGTGSESVARAILEEGLKSLGLVVLFVWQRAQFAGWRQGIGYAGLIGAGFVLGDYAVRLEDLLPAEQWEAAFFWRMLVFGGLPGLCTGIAGVGLGVARTASSRPLSALAVVAGLAGATAANALLRSEIVAAETLSAANALPPFGAYLLLVGAYLLLYAWGRRRVAQVTSAVPTQ
ncbi:MAG: PrsW family glutamic-type intramembrane protease [Anaerolineae bacterium]|nr:PrsW family glutamic-type intramembrane protease [Anaerolineae bacterium]